MKAIPQGVKNRQVCPPTDIMFFPPTDMSAPNRHICPERIYLPPTIAYDRLTSAADSFVAIFISHEAASGADQDALPNRHRRPPAAHTTRTEDGCGSARPCEYSSNFENGGYCLSFLDGDTTTATTTTSWSVGLFVLPAGRHNKNKLLRGHSHNSQQVPAIYWSTW